MRVIAFLRVLQAPRAYLEVVFCLTCFHCLATRVLGQGGGEAFNRFTRQIDGVSDPAAVAIDRHGLWYVAEAGGNRVRSFDADGNERRAYGNGELRAPRGVAVDDAGNVYVSDTGHDRVVSFDSEGKVARIIGSSGTGLGELRRPRGLALAHHGLYVADTGNRRVQFFDERGLAWVIGSQFEQPVDVVCGQGDSVFVIDAVADQWIQLDQQHRVVARRGDHGSYSGLMSAPSGGGWWNGHLYVADANNHRLQVFEPSGEACFEWGLHALAPRQGHGYLHYPNDIALCASFAVIAEGSADRCQIFAHEFDPAEQVKRTDQALLAIAGSPHYGMRIRTGGTRMAINDPETHAISILDIAHGEALLIGRVGGYGARSGELRRPDGLALDRTGRRLYVCDSGNHRLELFSLAPPADPPRFDVALARFVKSLDLEWFRAHHTDLKLRWPIEPVAIALGASRIYLLDSANGAVIVLNADFSVANFSGGLQMPSDITVGAREAVYVVDAGTRRVHAFDAALNRTWEAGPEVFSAAWGIAAAPDGTLFVTDADRNCIVTLSGTGDVVSRFGSCGVGPGEFSHPRGCAFARWGAREALIVIDHANHRGVVCSPTGTFVHAFGPRAYTDPANHPGATRLEQDS